MSTTAEQTGPQGPETDREAKNEQRGLTLRALVENEFQVMQALYDSGGELTPEIEAMLRLSEDAMPEKVDGYAHMIDRLQNEGERLAVIAKQYSKMMTSIANAIDWMKDTLCASMQQLEIDELKGVDRKFRLQRSQPKLEVQQDHLPATYIKEEVVYKNDTKQIKADLESGIKVPGARLVESYHVRVYANSPTKIAEPKKKRASRKNEVQ